MSAGEVRAMLTSSGGWGWSGSTDEHFPYVVAVQSHRKCRWGHDGWARVTHAGMCNGLAMTSGCEWHVRQWARDVRARQESAS